MRGKRDEMLKTYKALHLLTVLAALVFTTGCGEKPDPSSKMPVTAAADANDAWLSTPDEPPPLPDEPEDAMTAAILKPWSGDFDGMVERRFIRVLTVYSRTMFFVDKGTERGIVADMFRLYEEDLNKRLGKKNVRIHITFVPVAHNELIPALLEGRGDIVAAGKTITAWRREKVDFTNPTKTNVSSIIVTGPGVPPLESVQDLSGREAYIRESDVSAENVKRFNAELAAAGKPPVKIRPAPEVLADEDLLEMVNAGLAPMTMVDDYVGEFWKQIFPGIVLNTKAAVRTDGQNAMMVRKNSPKLLAVLNPLIKANTVGSAFGNTLTTKYLKNVKYVKNATSEAEIAKFRKMVEAFRKFGQTYDMDFLLMMAQGYQESRLDNSAKSRVGAIGVMQVMPATGKELAVGDIKREENNIHAGVKYMRKVVDTYFKDDAMTPLNKTLMAFASYNAGPNRIKTLRQETAKRGLDPNVWFNNVERVVAEKIGRETVTYVGNIYKYYIAYTLVVEELKERDTGKKNIGG